MISYRTTGAARRPRRMTPAQSLLVVNTIAAVDPPMDCWKSRCGVFVGRYPVPHCKCMVNEKRQTSK